MCGSWKKPVLLVHTWPRKGRFLNQRGGLQASTVHMAGFSTKDGGAAGVVPGKQPATSNKPQLKGTS